MSENSASTARSMRHAPSAVSQLPGDPGSTRKSPVARPAALPVPTPPTSPLTPRGTPSSPPESRSARRPRSAPRGASPSRRTARRARTTAPRPPSSTSRAPSRKRPRERTRRGTSTRRCASRTRRASERFRLRLRFRFRPRRGSSGGVGARRSAPASRRATPDCDCDCDCDCDSDADASSSAPSRGRRKGPAAAAFDAAYSSLTTRHRHPTSPWSCAIARTIRTTVSTGSRERASDPATSAETASAATRSPPWCSPSHRTTTSSLRTCGATILRAARARHAKRAWLRSRAASEACVEANLGACFATSASAARSMSSSKRASRPAPLRRGSLRRRAKIPRRHHACSKRSSHARQRSGSQWCAARREAGDGDARTRAPRREDASMEDWEVAEERETRS